MTQSPNILSVNDFALLQFHFQDLGEIIPLSRYVAMVDSLQALCHAGYWIDAELRKPSRTFDDPQDRFPEIRGVDERLIQRSDHAYWDLSSRRSVREELEETVFLYRASFESPVQIDLGLPGAIFGTIGSAIAAGRGVIYLMSRWQAYRVESARANLESAAYEVLTQTLPNPRPGIVLPTDEEIARASRALALLQTASISQAVQIRGPSDTS